MIDFAKNERIRANSVFCIQFKHSFVLTALAISISLFLPGLAGAEAPELKPVLKAIDPSSAKLDIVQPPKVAPQRAPSTGTQNKEPNYRYTPYRSSNSQPNANQAPPRSGSYGMSPPTPKPYVPSTNPNNRYNQVFTPPWKKNAPPSQSGYQGQRTQNPNYLYQGQPSYQNQAGYGNPNQGYRPPQPYQGGYQARQPYGAQPNYQNNQRQYYRPPAQGYYPPQNQYQQPYNNRQTYRPPVQNQYGYQGSQPSRQNMQRPIGRRAYPQQGQNRSSNNGFPSANLIPEFGKPLPMNASNKGPGGRWTSSGQQGQFNQQQITQKQASPEARVDKLEQTAFGSTYPEHDVEARLDHLEKEIFGAKSSGSVSSRLSKLEYKLGGKGAFHSGYTGSKIDQKKDRKVAKNTKRNGTNKSDIGTTVSATDSSKVQELVDRIPYNKRAGDYFNLVKKFPGESVARWTTFPVKVRVPNKTPEIWKESISSAVSVWSRYFPIKEVDRTQSADIELSWVNHLPPKILGITRLRAYNGQIKIKIFLLRPTYYVPSLAEKALQGVLVHELGHALGIFTHSDNAKDTMFVMQLRGSDGKLSNTNFKKIGARDLNTLRRIYESPALPAKFTTAKPIEWAFRLPTSHS